MGRYVTDVQVVGTWDRTITSPADITMVRQSLQDAPRKGYRLEGKLTAAQKPVEGSRRHRHGTFSILVRDVPGYYTPRRPIGRAAQYIKWFLADTTCRMPKLKVDYEKSYVSRHWEA